MMQKMWEQINKRNKTKLRRKLTKFEHRLENSRHDAPEIVEPESKDDNPKRPQSTMIFESCGVEEQQTGRSILKEVIWINSNIYNLIIVSFSVSINTSRRSRRRKSDC